MVNNDLAGRNVLRWHAGSDHVNNILFRWRYRNTDTNVNCHIYDIYSVQSSIFLFLGHYRTGYFNEHLLFGKPFLASLLAKENSGIMTLIHKISCGVFVT